MTNEPDSFKEMNELTTLTQVVRIEGQDVEAGRPKMAETADVTRPRGS